MVQCASSPPGELGPPLGEGWTCTVHTWGEGDVLKLFHRGRPVEKVEREFQALRAIQALGLPVPAARELIEVDGRYGIVMERVAGISLLRRVQSQPWTLFAAVRELAELHVRINACRAPAGLPLQREWIAKRIDSATNLTERDRERARCCLADLPDGDLLCHGDFHPDNVIFTARGPVIIDWDTATRGVPAGDAACTSHLIQRAHLPDSSPAYMHALLATFRGLIHRGYLSRYVRSGLATRPQIVLWQAPLAAAAIGGLADSNPLRATRP
ncbi:MAG: aminoglycoside phosphotransferase family protein [Planctomycetaceae bacterium]|nr:aminoglycoside phosphotransferase family protein [Planctomycetaceae bacterium]